MRQRVPGHRGLMLWAAERVVVVTSQEPEPSQQNPFSPASGLSLLQALLVLAPRRPGVYVVRGRTTGQKVNLTRTYPAALAPLRPRCPRTATTATAAASRGVVAGYRGHVANAHTLYLSVPSPGPPARRSPRTGGRYMQLPTTVFSRSLRHRAPRKSTPINKVVALNLTASSCVSKLI